MHAFINQSNAKARARKMNALSATTCVIGSDVHFIITCANRIDYPFMFSLHTGKGTHCLDVCFIYVV